MDYESVNDCLTSLISEGETDELHIIIIITVIISDSVTVQYCTNICFVNNLQYVCTACIRVCNLCV